MALPPLPIGRPASTFRCQWGRRLAWEFIGKGWWWAMLSLLSGRILAYEGFTLFGIFSNFSSYAVLAYWIKISAGKVPQPIDPLLRNRNSLLSNSLFLKDMGQEMNCSKSDTTSGFFCIYGNRSFNWKNFLFPLLMPGVSLPVIHSKPYSFSSWFNAFL